MDLHFILICCSESISDIWSRDKNDVSHHLYGLTKFGTVYMYDERSKVWNPLPMKPVSNEKEEK